MERDERMIGNSHRCSDRRAGDLLRPESAQPAEKRDERERQSRRVQLRRRKLLLTTLPRAVCDVLQGRLSRIPHLRWQRQLEWPNQFLWQLCQWRGKRSRGGDPLERNQRQQWPAEFIRVRRLSHLERRLRVRASSGRQSGSVYRDFRHLYAILRDHQHRKRHEYAAIFERAAGWLQRRGEGGVQARHL